MGREEGGKDAAGTGGWEKEERGVEECGGWERVGLAVGVGVERRENRGK